MTPTKFKSLLEKMTKTFDVEEFAYDFLIACGKPEPTIKRLRNGDANESDVNGGVLLRRHIHIKACEKGGLREAMDALRNSRATKKMSNKVKFLLACDGQDVIMDIRDDSGTPPIEFSYHEFPERMQYLRSLAGLPPVKKPGEGFTENEVDASAAKDLNKLYMELMRKNPDWVDPVRRDDIHQFLARLIFCFFAEDTGVFRKKNTFTQTIKDMSAQDGSNTSEVIAGMFREMNNENHDGDLRYVNGGLFAGSLHVPEFGRKGLRLLIEIGDLNWTEINPDIFGSMIQTITATDEISKLGMHYTSEQNIMKVLTPLFLGDLESALKKARNDKKKLTALRDRIARIRVFDPACGSGNFLVIAYKSMRNIEARINKKLGEAERESVMELTNFRGIEYKKFPARIARLALVIAEFQCDEKYRGHTIAVSDLLPLGNDVDDWITRGNALRLDWMSECPPASVNVAPNAYGELSLDQTEQKPVKFQSVGSEVYICGNPPFISAHGSNGRSSEQTNDLEHVFRGGGVSYGDFDYVTAWFFRAVEYMQGVGNSARVVSAFVSTSSVCQGRHVPDFWPAVFKLGCRIGFAYTSFVWKNHATDNANVSVVIVGLSNEPGCGRIYSNDSSGDYSRCVDNINPYLVPGNNTVIRANPVPIREQSEMFFGNHPIDDGGLVMSPKQVEELSLSKNQQKRFVKSCIGSKDFINGSDRCCLWVDSENCTDAYKVPSLRNRFESIRKFRLQSTRRATHIAAETPHQFASVVSQGEKETIFVPIVSSERREYLPVGLLPADVIVLNSAFGLFDAPRWNLSLLSSRLHMVWVATVCGKLENRLRYSNTLCWNTFPIPELTFENKQDMNRCAENILVARKHHPEKTIADLYDPDKMPDNLWEAHALNDKLLADIYAEGEFRDDTDMRETLFRMYEEMMKDPAVMEKLKKPAKRNKTKKGGLFNDGSEGNST